MISVKIKMALAVVGLSLCANGYAQEASVDKGGDKGLADKTRQQ